MLVPDRERYYPLSTAFDHYNWADLAARSQLVVSGWKQQLKRADATSSANPWLFHRQGRHEVEPYRPAGQDVASVVHEMAADDATSPQPNHRFGSSLFGIPPEAGFRKPPRLNRDEQAATPANAERKEE